MKARKFSPSIKKEQRQPVQPRKSLFDIYYAELMNKKLGLSKEDIENCERKSVEACKKLEEKFKSQLAETKVDVRKMLESHLAKNGRLFSGPPPPWAPPPPPDLLKIYLSPSPAVYQHCHVHAAGKGDGIGASVWLWGFDDEQWDSCRVDYDFSFTPLSNGTYNIWTSILSAGPYYLVADDGALNSKNVTCGLGVTFKVQQKYTVPVTPMPGVVGSAMLSPTMSSFDYYEGFNLFEDGGQNISVQDSAIGTHVFDQTFYFLQNNPVTINLSFTALVVARGDGSVADLDLSGNNGAIACPGVQITQIS
jgi:hypothetical protein